MAEKARRPIVQQLIEDSFNSIKKAIGKRSNTVCTSSFALATVLDDKVLSKKHSYDEVCRHNEFPERSAQLPADANAPVLRKSKMDERMREYDFSTITGYTDSDWFSPGAPGMGAPFADLEALRSAHSTGQMNFLGQRNWCRLISKDILIKRKDSDTWLLGVGNLDASVGIAWPVDALDGNMYSAQKGTAKPVLLTLLDVNEWEAMPLRWLSPMHQARKKEMRAIGGSVTDTAIIKLKESSHYGTYSVAAEATGPA